TETSYSVTSLLPGEESATASSMRSGSVQLPSTPCNWAPMRSRSRSRVPSGVVADKPPSVTNGDSRTPPSLAPLRRTYWSIDDSVCPLSMTPLSMTPLSMTPLSMTPLSMTPLSMTPFSTDSSWSTTPIDIGSLQPSHIPAATSVLTTLQPARIVLVSP